MILKDCTESHRNFENFTGVGSSYEAPVDPEIHLPTAELSVEQSVERLLTFIDAL